MPKLVWRVSEIASRTRSASVYRISQVDPKGLVDATTVQGEKIITSSIDKIGQLYVMRRGTHIFTCNRSFSFRGTLHTRRVIRHMVQTVNYGLSGE